MSVDETSPQPARVLGTAVIPWTDGYLFDEACFGRQVSLIARQLTRSIYVFGTAGEGYAVTEKQFDTIADAFWRISREHAVSPMLGVISLSLSTIIDRISRGAAMGFRTFQLSLPSWGPLNDRELDTFFAETCGRFPDCDFHLYNVHRMKRQLTSVELARAAGDHPNFVAVKSGAKDPEIVSDLLKVAPRLRFYFTERGYAQARLTHDVGLLISVASIHPERALAFIEGTDESRERDLMEIQVMGTTLRSLAAGKFHMDGAFDKMLIRVNLPDFPLRLLPPYAAASETDFEHFLASIPAGWKPCNPGE
jgi:dihydrodipicolinate synthase/N-acetylneuraminate lyase